MATLLEERSIFGLCHECHESEHETNRLQKKFVTSFIKSKRQIRNANLSKRVPILKTFRPSSVRANPSGHIHYRNLVRSYLFFFFLFLFDSLLSHLLGSPLLKSYATMNFSALRLRSSQLCFRKWPTFLMLMLTLLPRSMQAMSDESLNAYIPATHKRVFEEYNALILGDISVAKAAFRGALAVQGKADLADFDIAGDKACNKDVRSVVVGRMLTARMGSINNGYTVVGRGSNIHHSVTMNCTNRVERHDPVRNDDIDFKPVRVSLIRETADFCMTTSGGTVISENSTMKFDPGEKGFSCYTVFQVTTSDLRLVDLWKYIGDDFYRNVVIVVTGLRADFRNFRMEGFNPRRTLIVFCAVYGSYGLYNAKFHASILAPTSAFTTMEAIINGSVVLGSLRGSIATLNVPYVTC